LGSPLSLSKIKLIYVNFDAENLEINSFSGVRFRVSGVRCQVDKKDREQKTDDRG
jgi:hypothetical protein